MPYLHVTMRWDAPIGHGHDPRMRDLWVRMRCSVPTAVAAVVLPTRTEVVVRSEAKAELRACVRAAGERAVLQGIRVELTTAADDSRALHRMLVSVLAAPTHLQEIDDPLRWPWSTVRDVLGAAVDPWVTADALADALPGVHPTALLAEAGVAAPRPAACIDEPSEPIGEVLRAAAAATRRPVEAVRRPGPTRRLFVGLARRHGWWMPRHLATICGITRRSLYKQLEHIPLAWLHAGALCLGDERLRAVVLASHDGRRRAPAGRVTGARVCSSQ